MVSHSSRVSNHWLCQLALCRSTFFFVLSLVNQGDQGTLSHQYIYLFRWSPVRLSVPANPQTSIKAGFASEFIAILDIASRYISH